MFKSACPRRRGGRRAAQTLAFVLVAAVSLLTVTACGGAAAGNGASATGASLPKVTVGYEDAPDPEMVAIAQKYFGKYMHADVTMKYYSSGPQALDALSSGALQFMTVLGNPPLATAIAKGVPLQVIWAQDLYTTGEGLVVRKGKGIESLKDLEGKTVALNSGSSSSFELAVAEQQAGIPAGSIKIDNMTPPGMVAAWKRGDINAAYVWVPFFSEMVGDGGKALLYDQSQGSAAPIFNLAVVNTAFAKKYPAMVDGFVRAEAAGVSTYQHDPTQAYQDMAQVGAITVAQAKAQSAGLKFLTLQEEVTAQGLGSPGNVADSLVTQSLAEAGAWLKSSGRVGAVPASFAAYVNPSYAAAVLQAANSGSPAS